MGGVSPCRATKSTGLELGPGVFFFYSRGMEKLRRPQGRIEPGMICAQPSSQRRGSLGQSGKWFPQCHSEHHWLNQGGDPGFLGAGPALSPHDALNGSENSAVGKGGHRGGWKKRPMASSRDSLWQAGAQWDGCHGARSWRLPEPVGSDFDSLSVSLLHTHPHTRARVHLSVHL